MSGLEIVGPEEVYSLVFLDEFKAKGDGGIVKYELVQSPSWDRLVDEAFGLIVRGREIIGHAVEAEGRFYSLG